MSKQLNVKLPSQISERLEKASEQTGLTKSEISRRGILDQVDKLQEDK